MLTRVTVFIYCLTWSFAGFYLSVTQNPNLSNLRHLFEESVLSINVNDFSATVPQQASEDAMEDEKLEADDQQPCSLLQFFQSEDGSEPSSPMFIAFPLLIVGVIAVVLYVLHSEKKHPPARPQSALPVPVKTNERVFTRTPHSWGSDEAMIIDTEIHGSKETIRPSNVAFGVQSAGGPNENVQSGRSTSAEEDHDSALQNLIREFAIKHLKQNEQNQANNNEVEHAEANAEREQRDPSTGSAFETQSESREGIPSCSGAPAEEDIDTDQRNSLFDSPPESASTPDGDEGISENQADSLQLEDDPPIDGGSFGCGSSSGGFSDSADMEEDAMSEMFGDDGDDQRESDMASGNQKDPQWNGFRPALSDISERTEPAEDERTLTETSELSSVEELDEEIPMGILRSSEEFKHTIEQGTNAVQEQLNDYLKAILIYQQIDAARKSEVSI